MDFSKVLNSIYLKSGDLAVVLLSISVLLCLVRFKKLELPFQRLLYFLLLNLIIEILARFFAYYTEISNLPLLHIYTLGEFVLLSWFYESLLTKPPFFKNNYWPFVVGGALLIILNSLFVQSIFGFNSIAKTFVQVVIISLAILYFYNLTENQSFSPPIRKSLRLINSAIIVYYSGSLFIFMCGQISFESLEKYRIFWAFNAVFNLIFQALILWGIWKVVFRKATSSS